MQDEVVTTGDLLIAWRDAMQAAELAERLALLARQASDEADTMVAASEELAALARVAATASEHAAASARAGAARAGATRTTVARGGAARGGGKRASELVAVADPDGTARPDHTA